MGRPTTKTDLIDAAKETYAQMNAVIDGWGEQELSTPFAFNDKKKEAHWKRDKNLRDVLIHLYEWHQLVLHWVSVNREGGNEPLLPKPYNWRTYGELNMFFWKKHQNTTLEEAKALLAQSHSDVLRLAEGFTNEELFSVGVYPWAGNGALGSYFVSNMSSHYNWAIKKLKAHQKNVKGGR